MIKEHPALETITLLYLVFFDCHFPGLNFKGLIAALALTAKMITKR